MTEIPAPERFYAAVSTQDELRLYCPAGDWSAPLDAPSSTVAAQQALAREHVDDRHRPESRCEVCGDRVSSWEYERFTPDMQVGRGLMVQPCGHQVTRIVMVVP